MVARPTRTSRIGLRVFPETIALLDGAVAQLEQAGVYTTLTELIESLIHERLPASSDELAAAIRTRRAQAPA